MDIIIDITKFKSFATVKKNFYLKLPRLAFDNTYEDVCWEWQGNKHWNGYGRINWGKNERYWAHRISYMIYKGPIPYNKIVMHTCDNPCCVNPKHLILGTQKDNLHDMAKRGRHGTATLNEESVKVIKWMLKYEYKRGLMQKLADLYKVKYSIIADIKRNKVYSWVNI